MSAVAKLAEAFCGKFRAALLTASRGNLALAENTLQRIITRNKNAVSHQTCASHDFFDANQAMIDAMESLGIEFDPDSVENACLTDNAWALAKACEFAADTIVKGVVTDQEVIDEMARLGGSFVKCLAEAARRADPVNLDKIKSAWPDYWDNYREFALKRKEVDAKAQAEG